MSTGTCEQFIAHRLPKLAERGLHFTYVVEGDKHWLKSKWGYWLSWPTAKQVDDYLAGMLHGAEFGTKTRDGLRELLAEGACFAEAQRIRCKENPEGAAFKCADEYLKRVEIALSTPNGAA